ncbi:FxSxx-COOH system tetratricopeptide repeat protein [Amycolatopsis sp. NPDC049691]|uniref:FxSxx-COOH system tetratricopeptide repeat protein n=1 Tax=Amycolatopsis sp. NPDC049691 TaxID=3155155 RepID=UPI00342DC66A
MPRRRFPRTGQSAHPLGGTFAVDHNLGAQVGDNNVQRNTFYVPGVRTAWPVRLGVPPQVVDHYQHRDARRQLAEALAPGGTRARGRSVVVSGLGGVGKSQLAAHHAWSVWPDSAIDLAVWMPALSRDAVITTYAEAARQVLSGTIPDIALRAPEEAAQLLRDWLAATSRRWLMVLDDVQDPQDLHGLWPPPNDSGEILLTSRRRDAALNTATSMWHRVIELGVYTEAEAIDFLTKALAGHAVERVQLQGFAEDLGRLPLALSQAVAFLHDKPLLTVASYRRRLADRRYTLADVLPSSAELPDQYAATVDATWSLSIERADRLRPRGLARPLLEVASLLDPHGSPLAVFTGTVVRDCLGAAVGREVDEEAVQDGLACLHRLNLLTLDPTRPGRAVAVHPLVQRAVRDALTPAHVGDLARLTADALLDLWPEFDTADRGVARTLRSCSEALDAVTASALSQPDYHPLLFRIGRSLAESGQITAATTHFLRLHRDATGRLGPVHPQTLAARCHLARLQGMAGDASGAVTEFEALRATAEDAVGADDDLVMAICNDLVHWRDESGDSAGAIAGYEQLLADHQRVLGPDHLGTLCNRGNLASCRGNAGDAAGALADLEALLVDQLRVLGPDHYSILITRRHLASFRGQTGDVPGAIAEYEMLLAEQQRVLGPDHPSTLTTRNNLIYWRSSAGDATRAVAEAEVLLADQRRVLEADHPALLTTRANLASWRGEAGDTGGAVAELEALLADQQRILGSDHPSVLSTRGMLARWRGEGGDPACAVAEYESVLADQRRVLGSDHRDTLITRNNLASWRGDAGDLAGAVEDLQALLADLERALGAGHESTLTIRNNLISWQTRADLQSWPAWWKILAMQWWAHGA